jgi:hypothetical protein
MVKTSILSIASLLATILFLVFAPLPSTKPGSAADAFSFASMGDGQANAAKFTITVNQIASLHPDFVIFNGDLENNGVISTEMNPMIDALRNAGLFDQTFLVRGNHDNVISGSAGLWESYFETPPNVKVLPAGVTEYVSLNSNSDQLVYSFIYGNAMFIGLDVPGNAITYLTSAQITFLDARLTYAESRGLIHAFIYFHGPIYCVSSLECDCSSKTNVNCTPSALVPVLNKHPIISATFHGHEHILGWTHMDNTRVAKLTGSFEQFLTSPAGGVTYNQYLYSSRIDYAYMGPSQGFATIDINGCSFTFNIYEDGTTSPVWTHSFTKDICPTPTATYTSTPSHTPTDTFTSTQTFTLTQTPTFTPTGTSTFTYSPSMTDTATPTSTVTAATTPTQMPTQTLFHETIFLPLVIKEK